MPKKNSNGELIVPRRTQWAVIVFVIISLASWGWMAREKLKAKGIEDVKAQVEEMAPEVKLNVKFRIETGIRLKYMEESLNRMMDRMGVQRPPKQGGK